MLHEEFDIEIIKNEVVPEIINDIKNTYTYKDNWIFDHLPAIADVFIAKELVQKDHIEDIRKFVMVYIDIYNNRMHYN